MNKKYTVTKKQLREIRKFCDYCIDVDVWNVNPFGVKGLGYKTDKIFVILNEIEKQEV